MVPRTFFLSPLCSPNQVKVPQALPRLPSASGLTSITVQYELSGHVTRCTLLPIPNFGSSRTTSKTSFDRRGRRGSSTVFARVSHLSPFEIILEQFACTRRPSCRTHSYVASSCSSTGGFLAPPSLRFADSLGAPVPGDPFLASKSYSKYRYLIRDLDRAVLWVPFPVRVRPIGRSR